MTSTVIFSVKGHAGPLNTSLVKRLGGKGLVSQARQFCHVSLTETLP